MAEKKTEPTEPTIKPITVRTTGATRFCRAGQRFGRTARRLTDYTPEQLVEWQAEQYLIVEFD